MTRTEVDSSASAAIESATSTGGKAPVADVSYLVASLSAGLLAFVVECVDRLAVLWPGFNGFAEPLAFSAYLAPAAVLGTLVGLALSISLRLGRLVVKGLERILTGIPGRARSTATIILAIVAVAVALRALTSLFPEALQVPVIGVLRKYNSRIVPIPFVLENFSLLVSAAMVIVATIVIGIDRVFENAHHKWTRRFLAVVAPAASIGMVIVYAIDSRVSFGRYEHTIHIPGAVLALVLAFVASASTLAIAARFALRVRRVVVWTFLAVVLMSGYAFLTLGSNENLKALLWRRSIIARRAYQGIAYLSDRDRDGFASIWNSGDADDTDASINPYAVDVPGNGVDENGFGGDAVQAVAAPSESVAPAPIARNFLFVAIDTLRADRMSVYGYGRPTSPRLTEWAREGRLYERAYSPGSNTGISFASMQRAASGKYVFDKERPTLFGTLQSAGFVTAQINARRDDLWLETKRWVKYRKVILDGIGAVTHKEGDPLWNADTLTTAAIEYLSSLPQGSRHATWIHYLDPHEPRMKMAPFDFGDSDSDQYDSEVAFADREVGRLLDFLKSSGALADTIVVLVADHGEAFGEHGVNLHGNRPNDEQIWVPLMIWAPGLAPGRISTPVTTLDVAPTVLGCLGFTGMPNSDGLSLIDEPPARPVFGETPINLQDVNFHAYAVTDGEWRYIYDLHGGTRELYDLGRDPLELHNLADAQPARLASIEKLLWQHLDRVGVVRPEH